MPSLTSTARSRRWSNPRSVWAPIGLPETGPPGLQPAHRALATSFRTWSASPVRVGAESSSARRFWYTGAATPKPNPHISRKQHISQMRKSAHSGNLPAAPGVWSLTMDTSPFDIRRAGNRPTEQDMLESLQQGLAYPPAALRVLPAPPDAVNARAGLAGRRAGRRGPVSYTHLRAHETVLDLVCRLLLEQKKENHKDT